MKRKLTLQKLEIICKNKTIWLRTNFQSNPAPRGTLIKKENKYYLQESYLFRKKNRYYRIRENSEVGLWNRKQGLKFYEIV
jgi:hypothetical protein